MGSADVFLSQIFVSLETFLKKTTTLNIFDALMFDYKIKIGSVEECSPQFLSFAVDLYNDLQRILKDNVDVGEFEKSKCAEKSETTLCVLQPVDPEFVELSVPPTDKLECGNRGHWEPNISQDTETNNLTEITSPDLSAPHKNVDIFTCLNCNRKYRTKKKFLKHVCKSAQVLCKPQEEEYVDDPEATEAGQISQIGAQNQMENDGDSTPASGGGVEALLQAARFIEDHCKAEAKKDLRKAEEIEEYEFIRLLEVVSSKEKPLIEDSSLFSITHDHPYMLSEQISPFVKEKQGTRRVPLMKCYKVLRNPLPLALQDEKTFCSVIHNAVWIIASLKREGQELVKELDELSLKNVDYKFQLSVLEGKFIPQQSLKNVLQVQDYVLVRDSVKSVEVETGSGKNLITLYRSSSSPHGDFLIQPESVTLNGDNIINCLRGNDPKEQAGQTGHLLPLSEIVFQPVNYIPHDDILISRVEDENVASRIKEENLDPRVKVDNVDCRFKDENVDPRVKEESIDSNHNTVFISKYSVGDVTNSRLPLKENTVALQPRYPFLQSNLSSLSSQFF